jgi:hypothetical protein
MAATQKGKLIKITDFSTETYKARKAQNNVFEALKENNCQPRLLFLAKLSFIIEGEIKTFCDKQKLKQFMTTKQVLHTIKKCYIQKRKIKMTLKIWERINLTRQKNQMRSKEESNISLKKKRKKQNKKNNKMSGITTYFSIISLNVNGLNSQIKRHTLVNWIKNKTQRFFAYKNCISLEKTNIGLE